MNIQYLQNYFFSLCPFAGYIMNRLGQSLNVDQVKVYSVYLLFFPHRLHLMLYLKEMISCADLNKDGKISFEEFQKLMIEPF